MKKNLIFAALLLSTTSLVRADELSGIKQQQEQLQQQNKALIQKLAAVEKRQKLLEAKTKHDEKILAQAPAATAQGAQWSAADLGKRLLDRNDDAPLTFHGITVYGGIDAGVAYQSHGTPLNSVFAQGLEYLVSKNSNHSLVSFAPDALSQSNIGIRGVEPLYGDLSAVFNLQTQFNPQSGLIADNLRAVTNQNGVPNANQISGSDSNKAGQAFQLAYAGVSSPTYGTLTFGRQNALTLDGVLAYDPMVGSSAFSVIGYQGTTSGGGDTEDGRLDNAIKYRLNYGPVRAAAMYKFAAPGQPNGQTEQGQAGFDYAGFSFDAIFSHVQDAVAISALGATSAVGGILNSNISALQAQGNGILNATVSDNTSVMLLAKYTNGAFKFYGGYENIRFQNPKDPLSTGQQTIGGYTLDAVNNNAYTVNKVLQIMWVGAKYSVRPDVDLTLAYYHYIQNSFGGTNFGSAALGGASNLGTLGCSTAAAANCTGTLDAVSGLVDYRLTKRFDVYAGAMWSAVHNGLASGYNPTGAYQAATGQSSAGTIDPTIGARFQF